MLRNELIERLRAAVTAEIAVGTFAPAAAQISLEISDPKNPEHGDYATNFAMVASKPLAQNPRAIAEVMQARLLQDAPDVFAAVEIAGPGFLNFRLHPSVISRYVAEIQALGEHGLPRAIAPAQSERINIEFVSVNPNGPITVGSGRGAAFGSTLANVLEAAGHEVHREYYINDGVNSEQMRLFAESVRSYVEGKPLPENGYKGDYVHEIAGQVTPPSDAETAWYQSAAQELMLARQRQDLQDFGVTFDTWFSEQSLHNDGTVDRELAKLAESRVADDEPYRTKLKMGKKGEILEVEREEQPQDEDDADGSGKTLWLRSTKFGDDMDRVLRRKDGRLTYIASDVAYHNDKRNRPENATRMLTILGPDHHGYIARLHAVLAALLRGPEDTEEANAQALSEARKLLNVVIFQIVRFVKEGKPAPMRKRDGNIYSLRDLMREIGRDALPNAPEAEQMLRGRDVARFFYLTRSHDTHMDFDIDLATKNSDDNPVFYVQYAHARICSVIARAEAEGFDGANADLTQLSNPRELALIKKVLDLPDEVQRAAVDFGVHRLTTYAIELARTYHHFYDVCRVIQPDEPALSHARVALCRAAAIGLRGVLNLLGVSAPERLDREAASTD